MTLTKKERSKISKNNMAKGTAFQRKIAKIFQTFCEKKGLETKFYSVPRSGGLRWTSRPDTIGDIVTPENFQFTIECKKRNSINLFSLFEKRCLNKSDDIINWYTQACTDADRAGRLPLLIFEKLRGQPVVVIPDGFYGSVFIWPDSAIRATINMFPDNPKNIDPTCSWWEMVVLVPLKDFLNIAALKDLFRKDTL